MKKRKKKLSLLQRALQERRVTVSDGDIELAMAWLRDQVGLSAIGKVYGVEPHHAYPKLAIGVREAYRKGLLREKKK